MRSSGEKGFSSPLFDRRRAEARIPLPEREGGFLTGLTKGTLIDFLPLPLTIEEEKLMN
jgi:hypothetical protein